MLENREAHGSNSAGWVPLPGANVFVPSNEVARRLHRDGGGWFQDNNGQHRPVDYGESDALIATLLKTSKRSLFGLAVSTVLPGLCIGPALNIAVDALAKKRLFRREGHALIRTDERIAIVSRSHAVRDLLAESTLDFGGEQFPFMSFPTFRLKRDGNEQAARFGRSQQRSTNAQFTTGPRFLFYDLSPMDPEARVPQCAVILAEISEADTPEYIQRLLHFAAVSKARFVFPIISLHDLDARNLLESHGYVLVTATAAAGREATDFTFSALSRATPEATRFRVKTCSDPPETALGIDAAYRMLRDMWRLCGDNPRPHQLKRAWNLLDELTAAPSSLRTLEAVRRDAARVSTIRFAIEKLSHIDCFALPESARIGIQLRWPHLIERLDTIYQMIDQRNPVAEKVAEAVVDADEPLLIIARSSTAVAALQRDLLFDWGWKDDGLIRIDTPARICREHATFRKVCVVGFNPAFGPQLYWSTLPSTLEIVAYPHMLGSIAAYQARVARLGTELLPKLNRNVLSKVYPAADVQKSDAPVFSLEFEDLSHQQLAFSEARRAADTADASRGEEFLGDEELTVSDLAAPHTSATDVDLEAIETADTDLALEDEPYVVAKLVDGGEFRASVNVICAVLRAGTEELTKIKAGDLSEGDRIVQLSEDEHRSVYALIAERTRHLFPIDDRALEIWDATAERLRAEYPVSSSQRLEDFYERLEEEHCDRGRQTMWNWISGISFAPEAAKDIEILMRVAGTAGDTKAMSIAVARELDVYRSFRRSIGRAIVRRNVQRAEGRIVRTRVDEEIDEVLELCDVREVAEVAVVLPSGGQASLFDLT